MVVPKYTTVAFHDIRRRKRPVVCPRCSLYHVAEMFPSIQTSNYDYGQATSVSPLYFDNDEYVNQLNVFHMGWLHHACKQSMTIGDDPCLLDGQPETVAQMEVSPAESRASVGSADLQGATAWEAMFEPASSVGNCRLWQALPNCNTFLGPCALCGRPSRTESEARYVSRGSSDAFTLMLL